MRRDEEYAGDAAAMAVIDHLQANGMPFIYESECGHAWVSSFPRTKGSTVPCPGCKDAWKPSRRELVSGPFIPARHPGSAHEYDGGYPCTPVYTVWRRADGYVAATCMVPYYWGHPYKARDGAMPPAEGFVTLLVTDDWPTAHALIRVERTQDEGWPA